MTVGGNATGGFVVDASVVLAVLLSETRRLEAESLLREATRAGIVVPAHWALEVGNILLTSERRGTLTSDQRVIAVAHLDAMRVRIDTETHPRAWRDTMELALRHRLTLYDAAYLELAVRMRVPLATFDSALARAAVAEGVAAA